MSTASRKMQEQPLSPANSYLQSLIVPFLCMFIEEAKTQNDSVRKGIKWKLTQPHELSTERWLPKSFQRSMVPTCYTPLYYCIVFSAFVFFPPCIFRFPVLDFLYDPIGLSVASSNPIPGYLRCGPDHALGRCVARGPYLAWCGGRCRRTCAMRNNDIDRNNESMSCTLRISRFQGTSKALHGTSSIRLQPDNQCFQVSFFFPVTNPNICLAWCHYILQSATQWQGGDNNRDHLSR